MSILVNLPRSLLDWLIPQTCLLCDSASAEPLCEPCQNELPWLRRGCDICALPLASVGLCPHCQQQVPSFDLCRAAFCFAAPISSLVNQFKHHRNFRNGSVLSDALKMNLQNSQHDGLLPDCLVPVPLHWRRQLRRGFNQAGFIANEIGKELSIPIRPLLGRSIATPKQQSLDRKARLKNLDNAFVIKQNTSPPNHVALIDDVMTTGATAEAASRVLKKAGVKKVEVWVLARTPAPGVGIHHE